MSPQLRQFLESISRILTTSIFQVGNDSISLLWLLKLLLAFLIVVVITNLFKQVLRDYLLIRLQLTQGHRVTIATLISYSTGALAFLIILSINGLNLASLAVVLGGLGVGIGFGLQDLTKNLVSGLTLLLEGKLQVGDYVEFNGLSGYIKEIAIRSTIIRTFDGGDVVVPNSTLVGNQVLNWSYKNFMGKIRLPIGVAYESDPIVVTETLLDSAYMEPAVLRDPPPRVLFKGFGDNSLNFELWVWVNRIDEGMSVKSSLNFIIEYNFRQAGLKIPFPQHDLWLRNPDALRPAFHPDGQGAGVAQPVAINAPPSMSIRQLLRQVPYLQYSSDLQLRGLIESGYRKFLADGEILFQPGEMGDSVYIILSGAIETVSIQLNKSIKTYSAGEFFGEAAIMLNVPYVATARALGKTSLFVIYRNSFEKLLHTCPRLTEILTEELSQEQAIYESIRQQLQDLGLLSMTEQHNSFVNWVQERLRNLLTFS